VLTSTPWASSGPPWASSYAPPHRLYGVFRAPSYALEPPG
jgi:hypothetical protein